MTKYLNIIENASPKVAKKLLKNLLEEPDKLINNPNIGQIEGLLKERKLIYRYLIFKNYKLIYSIDPKKRFIKITDVFDTRQNPTKIERSQ